MAGTNIKFLGKLGDAEIIKYYSECRALILPGVEDFGLTPVEAQACGRPVLAFRGGGALETVVEGESGLFFDKQTEESLIDTIKMFERSHFDSDIIRQNALRYDKEVFKDKIRMYVKEKYKEYMSK